MESKLTKVRLFILEMGFKQKEVAAKAGLGPSEISQICTGKLNATATQKSKIARALGKSVSELF